MLCKSHMLCTVFARWWTWNICYSWALLWRPQITKISEGCCMLCLESPQYLHCMQCYPSSSPACLEPVWKQEALVGPDMHLPQLRARFLLSASVHAAGPKEVRSACLPLLWSFQACPLGHWELPPTYAVHCRDIMIEIGMACDGGKDSLSMAATAGGEVVMAPGNLVVSSYVGCPDITQVRSYPASHLHLLSLSAGPPNPAGLQLLQPMHHCCA